MTLKNSVLKKIEEMSVDAGIVSIRELLFERVIAVGCVLGLLSFFMGVFEFFLQGKETLVPVCISAYLPVLVCFLLQKKIPYHYRAAIVLLDAYILAVLILAGVGLRGAGIPLLITFSVLTTAFLGINMGIAAVLMSVLSILAVGVSMGTGKLCMDVVAMASSPVIKTWSMAAFFYMLMAGIMVVCTGILQNSLQQTIEIIREKTAALQDSNQRLKKALKDREEMEAKLIKSEKLEAMGLLAGGVAHDLNNILTGVTSYPELLLLKMSPEHELYAPMKVIKSSGDKAATIVRDLLTLSRRGVIMNETLNLTSIIQAYLQSPEYAKLLQFHPDVSVKTDLDENLANIFGSTVHLASVVMNLMSNAAEAMPSGGKIHVASRNVFLHAGLEGYEPIPRGEYVSMAVSDTGSGISEVDLEKLFEPFFTKKKMGRSGTGLGMAIVLGSVKDHHGYINIETSENRGTRFTLYFPVTKEAVHSKPPAFMLDKFKGQGQQILFVDDVKEQRDVGENVLKNLGYTPICTDSGEKAVEFCRTQKPDLLVLDMIMDPGMDGYETLKAVRKLHPNLYAVIISGYSETDQVKAALNLGLTMFLKKPYVIEEFAVAIHTGFNILKEI